MEGNGPSTGKTQVHRQRRAAAIGFGLLAVVLVAVVFSVTRGGEDRPTAATDSAAAANGKPATKATPTATPAELPRGGRTIFPDFRVIAFYGNPAARQLGILGIGSPAARGRQLAKQSKGYQRKSRPVLPAFELISTVANAAPGDDGLYRRHESNATIRRYLKAARKAKAMLILDIQPGRSDFFEETTRLKRWLREPDVGLALDPEWRVQAGQVPGKVIGSVSAREVNATTAWLDQLIAKRNLPQKLVVIHQFTDDMISDRAKLKSRKHLAITLNADGFGTPPAKLSKYQAFTKGPKTFAHGFKLFYEEDTNMMTPEQVMRISPRPDFVVYE